MATTGELEEHKQQVKIQLDTRLKALIKIKKEHCRIAIKMSKKATNVTPQPQPFTIQQVSAEVYTAQIAMSWHKDIYIYYKECVALMYINIILYQIGRRKGIKRRKIKRDKVHGRKSKLEEMKKNH